VTKNTKKNGDEILKKGFCFLSKQEDLRSIRQNFEYTVAPGSGAHDALKFELVARRSWSQEIKKRKIFCFSKKTKYLHLRPAKF
jgi:hypothetical protein